MYCTFTQYPIVMNKTSPTATASIVGFENPTNTFRKQALNLDELFVHSPASMRVVESPIDYLKAGIAQGDWLLVDSSRLPLANDVVICERFDEVFVSTWSILCAHVGRSGQDMDELRVIGVVTLSVHHFRPRGGIDEHESLSEVSLHSMLVEVEHAALFCRAQGTSMMPHVFDNDILLLERNLDVEENDVCVIVLNDDLYCKRVHQSTGVLSSDNRTFKPYRIKAEDYLRLHGVVRSSLRLHRPVACMPS